MSNWCSFFKKQDGSVDWKKSTVYLTRLATCGNVGWFGTQSVLSLFCDQDFPRPDYTGDFQEQLGAYLLTSLIGCGFGYILARIFETTSQITTQNPIYRRDVVLEAYKEFPMITWTLCADEESGQQYLQAQACGKEPLRNPNFLGNRITEEHPIEANDITPMHYIKLLVDLSNEAQRQPDCQTLSRTLLK